MRTNNLSVIYPIVLFVATNTAEVYFARHSETELLHVETVLLQYGCLLVQ